MKKKIAQIIETFKYYKKIKDSNLGRDYGWYIECNNQIIAEIEQITEEYYRNSYSIKNIHNDYIKKVINQDFWSKNYDKFYYINRKFTNYKTDEVLGPAIIDNPNINHGIILQYRLLHVMENKKNYIEKIISLLVWLIPSKVKK